MSTDGPSKPQTDNPDWPGRDQGVPPPPTTEGVEEISRDQALISDDWAPEPPPSRPVNGSSPDKR
jgi:hypothetical protein